MHFGIDQRFVQFGAVKPPPSSFAIDNRGCAYLTDVPPDRPHQELIQRVRALRQDEV